MEALGALRWQDKIEAELQSKIGEFLSLKARLVNLQTIPSISIKSKANGLYAIQITLEEKLKENLKKIELMKIGGVQFWVVLELGEFVYRLDRHVKAVKALAREAEGLEPEPFINWKTWGIPIAILASGLITFMGMRSKRK